MSYDTFNVVAQSAQIPSNAKRYDLPVWFVTLMRTGDFAALDFHFNSEKAEQFTELYSLFFENFSTVDPTVTGIEWFQVTDKPDTFIEEPDLDGFTAYEGSNDAVEIIVPRCECIALYADLIR